MEKNVFKYYQPKFLAGLFTGCFVLLYLANLYLGVALLISSLGIVSFLIINQYFWNRYPFSLLFWTENFSGIYKGFIRYEYQDENGRLQTKELEHIKIISQTGSHIIVHAFTKKEDGSISIDSVSKNIHIECVAVGEQFKLTYSAGNQLRSGENKFSLDVTEVLNFTKTRGKKSLSGNSFSESKTYSTKGNYENLVWIKKNKFDF